MDSDKLKNKDAETKRRVEERNTKQKGSMFKYATSTTFDIEYKVA